MYVSYDAKKLKLVSGSTTIQGEADDATYGQNTVSRTLTFKPLSLGTTTISVARGDASMNIDTNGNSISYATAKKSITINPVVPKSTNNKLSSLTIENITLNPVFSPDVTNYTASVEAGTTEVNVGATASDTKASVAGIGKIAVVEGINNINIDVTAEDGSKNTYTIALTVKEFDPIEVNINKQTYLVVRNKTLLQAPSNYNETTVKIGDEDVPAFTNDVTKYNLVALKDNTGKIDYYVYEANKYTLYRELTFNGLVFYPIEDGIDIPKGYKKSTITVNDVKIPAYKLNASSTYALIYGMNVLTGKKDLYLYDSDEKTMQRYNDEEIKLLNQKNNTYLIIIISLIFVCLILVVLSIILVNKTKESHEDRKTKKLFKLKRKQKDIA